MLAQRLRAISGDRCQDSQGEGGDEFALLLTGVDAETAGHQMDNLQNALSAPLILKWPEVAQHHQHGYGHYPDRV